MRELKPPFRFNLNSLVTQARNAFKTRVGSVTLSLPFVSFNVSPRDVEKQVAREIVIRMADRRVLNAYECCDDCIDQAIRSLQEIRQLLVDKQVELAEVSDGALYMLVELQLEAIRQFITFEQKLREREWGPETRQFCRSCLHHPHGQHESYFAALEMLRRHLYRCLSQVARIADVTIPKIPENMRYDDAWQLEAYEHPRLPNGGGDK